MKKINLEVVQLALNGLEDDKEVIIRFLYQLAEETDDEFWMKLAQQVEYNES